MIHSLGPGGAEGLLVDLAEAAPRAGLDVSVIELVGEGDAIHAQALRSMGVPVTSLGLSSRWDPRAFPRALAAVEAQRPDVVHTHLKHADLVGGAVARRRGLPQVSTLHMIEDNVAGIGRGKRWLAGQARARLASRTVAVSDAQRAWYLSEFAADPGSVVTIRNGVVRPAAAEPGESAAHRRAWAVPDDGVVAINVAIMRRGKGHEDLLRAVALLPESSPLVLVLVGDGENRACLESVVASDPVLGNRVHFAGYRPDVPTLLQAADMVVHPSHADALPTALIHALATGTPVLATRVGGIPEVLGPHAELVEVGDIPALAAGMDRLARDVGRRASLARDGLARYDEMFEATGWARRLAGLYDEVVE